MYLRRFYTRPVKFFKDITFKDGINYIYAYRDEQSKSKNKNSLNNLGKSSFLDLIDFTLGADFLTDKNSRLYSAYELGFLKDITVYLEFDVNNSAYTIKRSFDSSNTVELKLGNSKYKEFSLIDFRSELSDIIFSREDYAGFYSNEWLRRLLSFYITILKTKKKEYPDPFSYLEFTNELQLLQYHLFLLNIDNRLIYKLSNKVVEIDEKKKLVNAAVKNFISAHQLKTISDVEDRIKQIKNEIEEIREKVKSYKLASSNKYNAERAIELTKKINNLSFENFSHQKKIETYNESLSTNLSIRLSTVEEIYNEYVQLLGKKIRTVLEEAKEFRKNLVRSRKDFILDEIEQLQKEIETNNTKIDALDSQRAEIYRILSTASAVKNLSDANALIINKEREAGNLEGQINTYTVYSKQVSDLHRDVNKIESDIIEFREKIRDVEFEFYKIFNSIYQEFYPLKKDASTFSFSIVNSSKVKSKFKIDILKNPERHGKARNRARTLIYSFAVLFYSMIKNYNAPRFLIHDGIFDGVDKIHFVDVIKLVKKHLSPNFKFQYIVTLIEEGVLTDKLDPERLAEHNKIIKEAILLLTPDKPLFKKSY
ncbi:MAG TPA: hypothetical protein DHV28_11225 [Ignavibacteriales bacterium]|nr:hypothetical protein [Ignavibacteriales bacterium]